MRTYRPADLADQVAALLGAHTTPDGYTFTITGQRPAPGTGRDNWSTKRDVLAIAPDGSARRLVVEIHDTHDAPAAGRPNARAARRATVRRHVDAIMARLYNGTQGEAEDHEDLAALPALWREYTDALPAGATGRVYAHADVTYTIAGQRGTSRMSIDLIAGYSTDADIPKIIAARYGVDVDRVDVTEASIRPA